MTTYQKVILKLLIMCTSMLIAISWKSGREVSKAEEALREAQDFMNTN